MSSCARARPWRLDVELRQGQAFSERAERIASRIGGGLLFALAAYILAGAAWSLGTRHGEAFSLLGLIVAVLAIPIMTWLARRKIALAEALGSRAMRADAATSLAIVVKEAREAWRGEACCEEGC